MRLLVDMSSLLWQSLLAGQDKEFGYKVEHEGKQVHVNGWQFGLHCAKSHLLSVMNELGVAPIDMIFVVEGQHSKARRRAIYAGYKEERGSRPPQAYDEFHLCKEDLTREFRDIGAQVCTGDGVEADDILAYLAKRLKGDVVILTRDGDMTTLIDDRTSLYQNGRLTSENKYGPFPCKYVPVYKALVGDGEEYKGAVGFGQKAFLDLLVWGGDGILAALEGVIKRRALHELEDDVAEFKPMRKIIDSAQHVYESYECALLHDEWVNTMRQPLVWSAGMVRGRDVVTDDLLRPFSQQVRLITRDNYDQAIVFLRQHLETSPAFALDIETSTPEESDEWLRVREKADKVDVFGSELVSLGLTFGRNGQYTYYFTVNHADSPNLTSEQVRDAVALIPSDKHIIIQNLAFELPILYACWGNYLKDNGWRGFLPNCLDTAVMSSYVDENLPQGLKQNSALRLSYQQETYEHVTTLVGTANNLPSGGQIVSREDVGEGLIQVIKRYKMNELTAKHVLSYGADDPICTMALYNHYRIIMEIEGTWDVMMEVEQKTAYVKALAFHKGVPFDYDHMLKLEREDAATYQKNWEVIREFLIEKGWEGTQCPVFTELTPADIKEACQIILGVEFKTATRTPSKMAKLMLDEALHPELAAHEDTQLLSQLIAENNVAKINDWMAHRFSGEPVFDLNSSKQMATFLYDTVEVPIRLVNKATPTEWEKKPLLAALVSNHLAVWAGRDPRPVQEGLWITYCEDNGIPYPCDKEALKRDLLKSKAKADEKAVAFALLLDVPDHQVLIAFQEMKKCSTRQTMFYNSYKHLRHWKDNRIHGQAGQCRAVTRRDTPNDPNLAQLPKKGEGVKFRECFLPHKKDAVVASLDFSGQELRQGAAQSGDTNMLACFIGDNLKDMHSLTAAGAMEKKWGKKVLADMISRFGQADDTEYTLFLRLRKCKDDAAVAKMADDLRKNAKNVNFLAQYDGQAPKLAQTLIITVEDAQTFLDAKYAMFSRFEEWKEEVKDESRQTGYVSTCMGARRHLRDSILSKDRGVAEAAMRQGPNFKIQGSSGEQTKLAQCRIWDSGILFDLDVEFYFSVHDELVLSTHKDCAVEAIRVVHDAMVVPYGGLQVPFLSSISLGPNFGDQRECGDWFIEENVVAALDKIFVLREPEKLAA